MDGVSKLSDDEIMAQSIVFLVAGFETTGKRKWEVQYQIPLLSMFYGECNERNRLSHIIPEKLSKILSGISQAKALKFF